MSVVTQISPSSLPLRYLKFVLSYIGIRTTHPSHDESFFYTAQSPNAWRKYDHELLFYKSIKESPFHIIYNDSPIDNETSLQIAYAMLKDKPILLTHQLNFANNVSPFLANLITKRVHAIYCISLSDIELTHLSVLLDKLEPLTYSLSKSDQILIHAGVRMHFRNIVSPKK